MINNFFRATYNGDAEQSLYNSLTKEAIQVQGYDVYYMPREFVNYDYLFGQDTNSKFDKFYIIEAYIKSFNGYEGQGDILSKFGLDIQDDLTLQIHIDRFTEVVTANNPDIIRPREGDLLYFALDRFSIFEISFVENKKPFYQVGKNYIYEISLKRFVYGNENIKIGVDDVDEIIKYGDTTSILVGDSLDTNVIYTEGEVVYQKNTYTDETIAYGTVLSFDGTTLVIYNVVGEFIGGYNIIGDDSGAEYTFPEKTVLTFDETSNNKIADNTKVTIESVPVIDKTEINPFADF
jgi:hypothetical protein